MIETLNALFVSICFVYAAITDHRTMRVPNALWLFMLPFALVSLYLRGISFVEGCGVVITYCMTYAFWFYGWWGAADTKGIMIFSLFYPDVVEVPVAFWTMLFAALLLIVWKLAYKEKLNVARPFFSVLCVSVIATILFILLLK